MSFQIRPQREFLVQPALPAPLSRLAELAHNLLWVWDREIRSMFRRLDPVEWRASSHNPVRMLGQVSQATLEKAAADARFVTMYRRACEKFDAYMASAPAMTGKVIAYFSMEYGLAEALPVYSGGLGVLSGDHMKGASDLAMPLVGVGLLYQKGYFRQSLNPDGWQIEKSPDNDFYTLPLSEVKASDGRDLLIDVPMPGGDVLAKVWLIQVGRVKLYMLDTNIPQNSTAEMRDITEQLYGGDSTTRIRQEIVLGIGGLRALRAMGYEPTVYHMNEGHSAFLALERIRVLMASYGLSFEEALETCRSNNVFTTHTPVPAGIDLFDAGLMHHYFNEYCSRTGFSIEQLLSLGRRNPHDQGEPFSMAILAIKASCWRNGVSRLHGEVSRQMWSDLWPSLPAAEVPITYVTNGVHIRSWLNGDLVQVYDNYLQPDWRDKATDPDTWKHVDDVPDHELWEAHKKRKRQLISFVRGRVLQGAQQRKASSLEIRRLNEALDPDVFTIGFARRFATYKRATLMLRDLGRLKRLLTNNRMPVQILIAGKAHPRDVPGKTLIREIFQLSRDPEIANRLIFIEDYSIAVARELVHGVDVWLNNPRRGEEACGTSGMKAGINGVLNLSILDGWFDESDDVSGGWAIGDREHYSDDQDDMHNSSLLSMLENEIVPLYYSAREDDVPHEWVRRMKQSIKALTPQYDARRMLDDYDRLLYTPAHELRAETRGGNFARSRQHAAWDRNIRAAWHNVRFLDFGGAPAGAVLSGHALPLHALVELHGLEPVDVRVEAVIGRVDAGGILKDTEIVGLQAAEQHGSAWLFRCDYSPQQTGRLGCAFRVSSNHFDHPLTRPTDALLKWG
ncbi:MAG: glycosyltransferase family 1 protein [Acidobacteria bacterium]|nr:glycosyltransferase family 1 protein [Acidobacteriota bacterium]